MSRTLLLVAIFFAMGCGKLPDPKNSMTNDQIVAEIKKCKDAGLAARLMRDWSGETYRIECETAKISIHFIVAKDRMAVVLPGTDFTVLPAFDPNFSVAIKGPTTILVPSESNPYDVSQLVVANKQTGYCYNFDTGKYECVIKNDVQPSNAGQ